MFLYYVIATLSILLYLHGFFPIPARPSQRWLRNNVTGTHPKYQKAVIVIIDGVRLDFVTATKTPFLTETSQSTGCFIQLKVETPTVTLPRIKALTTGNVPQFVDIILNLASPTKVEDSFIHRARANGKRIVFYGDDLWVKLFPEEFVRSEGTSSFFVHDYTEVDDNVTRNVKLENQRDDWDIMVLHYLGLDHIGHVYGPKSPLITTKLAEMDSIIEEIYKSQKNTLFVVTSDHGMRDSGGHGGSTHPETNVPFVILGMQCTNDTFPQIDIPANLAILLGFDIPATSIGQLQDSLLGLLSQNEYLQALKYNTIWLRNKMDVCEESIETANHFLELFQLNQDKELGDKAAQIYKSCSEKISSKLLKASIRQNLESLIIATVIGITVLLKILQNMRHKSQSHFEQFAMLALLFLQFMNFHSHLSVILVLLSLFLCFKNLALFETKHLSMTHLSFLTLLSIVHPLTFLSSSFLEEEHQFWYFFTNTFIVLQIFVHKKKEWVLLFAAFRFIRSVNQVGDKWAALPDLADWLLESQNFVFLQLVFVAGLVLAFFGVANYTVGSIFDGGVFLLIYAFRMVANEDVILGQILWFLIFLRLGVAVVTKEGFVTVWVLTISLLLKPYNVILIPVCIFASRLYHDVFTSENLIMAHWWLGNLLFFAQGHDNSLASVDISAGYIGLTQYEPLYVFPQVLSHTYALPVLSHLLLFTGKKVNVTKSLALFVLFRLYIVIVVFIVTFIHRHHLFIWSVFAPKMFVEASHFGFLFIEVCFYYLADVINKILL